MIMIKNLHGLLFVFLLAQAQLGYAQTNQSTRETELLRDPAFTQGVTQGYANHLTLFKRAETLSRWQSKGITNAQWAFWEISEQLYFAHNLTTPILSQPGKFMWSTTNQAKQLLITPEGVRFLYDTSKEWREGGRLDLPDKNGNRPKYGDANTTWPHFLLGQHFAKDNKPVAVITESEKLFFDKYQSLRCTVDIRLNRLLKSSTWDHHAEYGAGNHAIFYLAFILMPKSAQRMAETGKFYVLVPTIYSEGDNRHHPGSTPWLGLDQFGDGVYFSGSHPTLQAGKWVSYDIDVKQLVREAMTAATQKSQAQGKARVYRPEDYFAAGFLIGWEVWGGFDTDVEFKNLSVKSPK